MSKFFECFGTPGPTCPNCCASSKHPLAPPSLSSDIIHGRSVTKLLVKLLQNIMVISANFWLEKSMTQQYSTFFFVSPLITSIFHLSKKKKHAQKLEFVCYQASMKYINGQNGIFVEGVKFDGEKSLLYSCSYLSSKIALLSKMFTQSRSGRSIFTTLCFDEFFGSSFFSGVAVSLMHDGQ